MVNLPSLNAVMKIGLNRNALKLRLPCTLLLTSYTNATVLSFMSF